MLPLQSVNACPLITGPSSDRFIGLPSLQMARWLDESIVRCQYFLSTGFQLVMVTGLYPSRGLPPR